MRVLLLLVTFLCLEGCASAPTVDDHGGSAPSEAADGSSSPISQEKTWAIAKAEVTKREHWPDHPRDGAGIIHTAAYGSRRINRGGWRVVAHRAVAEGTPDGGGGCAYDPGVPAASIIIDRRGKIVSYSHSANLKLD